MTTHIEYTCRACERVLTVEVAMPTAAKTYGPPERCHDGDGGSVEPEACECGEPIDLGLAQDEAADHLAGAAEDAAEARMELWRELREA